MSYVSSSNLRGWELPDHYRPRQCAALWQTAPPDWRGQLETAVERVSGHHPPAVFFRADDIGAGGRAFQALCELFRHHEVPLGMAVVPAWLSDVRKVQLFESAPLEEPFWGWHQHGWRHVNWQRTGKKSEFGEQRPFEKQWRDVQRGQAKMRDVFGDHFIPVFTPPWNRFSTATLRILQDLGFKGASTAGPFPRGAKSSLGLKNLRVQLDLHTRKTKDGAADFQTLLEELTAVLGRRDVSGIMIHHHRMNAFAFQFLGELLHLLKNGVRARLVAFREILNEE